MTSDEPSQLSKRITKLSQELTTAKQQLTEARAQLDESTKANMALQKQVERLQGWIKIYIQGKIAAADELNRIVGSLS